MWEIREIWEGVRCSDSSRTRTGTGAHTRTQAHSDYERACYHLVVWLVHLLAHTVAHMMCHTAHAPTHTVTHMHARTRTDLSCTSYATCVMHAFGMEQTRLGVLEVGSLDSRNTMGWPMPPLTTTLLLLPTVPRSLPQPLRYWARSAHHPCRQPWHRQHRMPSHTTRCCQLQAPQTLNHHPLHQNHQRREQVRLQHQCPVGTSSCKHVCVRPYFEFRGLGGAGSCGPHRQATKGTQSHDLGVHIATLFQ